jgi:hypothetical protein
MAASVVSTNVYPHHQHSEYTISTAHSELTFRTTVLPRQAILSPEANGLPRGEFSGSSPSISMIHSSPAGPILLSSINAPSHDRLSPSRSWIAVHPLNTSDKQRFIEGIVDVPRIPNRTSADDLPFIIPKQNERSRFLYRGQHTSKLCPVPVDDDILQCNMRASSTVAATTEPLISRAHGKGVKKGKDSHDRRTLSTNSPPHTTQHPLPSRPILPQHDPRLQPFLRRIPLCAYFLVFCGKDDGRGDIVCLALT